MDDQMVDNSNFGFMQMPASVAPISTMNGMSDNIASMRWESDQMVVNLRIRLGAYRIVAQENGQTALQHLDNIPPMVNDVGIDRFIAIIYSTINPSVALSNIDDEEANVLIAQVLKSVVRDMVYNQERYGIDSGDMGAIMSVLKTLVFMQVKRPVEGHEARSSRNQIVEQRLESSQQGNNRRSAMNPFSWGGK